MTDKIKAAAQYALIHDALIVHAKPQPNAWARTMTLVNAVMAQSPDTEEEAISIYDALTGWGAK